MTSSISKQTWYSTREANIKFVFSSTIYQIAGLVHSIWSRFLGSIRANAQNVNHLYFRQICCALLLSRDYPLHVSWVAYNSKIIDFHSVRYFAIIVILQYHFFLLYLIILACVYCCS